MMWIAMPVLLLLALLGLASIEHQQAAAPLLQPASTEALDAGQVFMLYRNAVIAYVEANPTVGSADGQGVASASLSYPPGISAYTKSSESPQRVGNAVVLNADGSRTVYVWGVATRGEIAALVTWLGGDLSIGQVTANGWSTPALGPMGALPSGLATPIGAVVSVVQIGGD